MENIFSHLFFAHLIIHIHLYQDKTTLLTSSQGVIENGQFL